MLTRRFFVRASAVAMAGVGIAPWWLVRAAAAPGTRRKILVAIFQRGAMDGLNVVIPHGEAAYYSLRPNLAIPRPDGTASSQAAHARRQAPIWRCSGRSSGRPVGCW